MSANVSDAERFDSMHIRQLRERILEMEELLEQRMVIYLEETQDLTRVMSLIADVTRLIQHIHGDLQSIRSVRSEGLTEQEIASLPELFYQLEEDVDVAQCSICLGEFQTDDALCPLPCNHLFHKTCIGTWLARKRSCPCCRRDACPVALLQTDSP